MPGILLEIQETVKKYADIMSKIAQVEVEVVDENLFRVAGTGIFAGQINEDMSSEGYVYKYILHTGNTELIYNPGKEELCRKCPKRDGCREEIEISMPLRLGGEMIGVIGLVGSTKEQKELILSNETMYLELLSQIADFISAKAAEVMEMKKRAELLDTLDCVINHIERGILIFGNDNVITMANESAKNQLSLEQPEGKLASVEATGDNISNQYEYKLILGDREYFIMGHLNSIDMIGSSQQTLQMQEEIKKIAKSTSTVLITGESGTGKELVATAIWKASDRKDNRFIAINCAAIPEPLLESELFGYVKGAFTGADPNGRIGKFELADKGVIFLDEIGDMPLYLQVKLLRVLQERKIIRIGSNQVIPIDVRVIAATNKNLKEMMEINKFREDLYYRLNVIPFYIPPLRERREDIRELVSFFANRYAQLFGKRLWKISEEAMEYLYRYPWHGNVRELENTVEFMINMMEGDGILDTKTLPDNVIRESYGGNTNKDDTKVLEKAAELKEAAINVKSLRDLETAEIKKALQIYGSDTEGKRKASKALGIGLATLYRKLEGIV